MSTNGSHKKIAHLIIGAIGVVYGDIGTSPLYTLRECVSEAHFSMTEGAIMGLLSLIFWSITLVVSLKYVLFILRADNNGEGGVLALLSLTLRQRRSRFYEVLFAMGLIGAALFCGEAMITPAISVLSAVEGIAVASPEYQKWVIPLSVIVLIGLFLSQRAGTAKIGSLFGPTMVIWFSVIGVLGVIQICQEPKVLKALNPMWALQMFEEHGLKALLSLSSVVLAITGAEALYADMGHFGRPAIQRAWFILVFPCLVLNYFGQGSILLQDPQSYENPFFFLVPSWGVYPLTLMATLATVIASQAVISGIFSISWQAIQLGYLPRMRVLHTSAEHIGQVYVPMMNRVLMVSTILLVVTFKTSGALAEAYGFAVTGMMFITSIMTAFLSRYYWQWRWWQTVLVFSGFVLIDTLFFAMNTVKILDGAWLPIVIGLIIFTMMMTWVKGRKILIDQGKRSGSTVKTFMKTVEKSPPVRIPGTAVYMSSTPDNLPNALLINFRHNKILHEKVILLSLITRDVPFVPRSDKIVIYDLGSNVYKVIAYYGFKEIPNASYILDKCAERGLVIDAGHASFFLSRGIPVSSISPHLNNWQEQLFIFLAKNALSAADFFKIPHNRVMEIGIRVKV